MHKVPTAEAILSLAQFDTLIHQKECSQVDISLTLAFNLSTIITL